MGNKIEKKTTLEAVKVKWCKPIIVAIIAAIVVQVLWGIGIPAGNWLQDIIFKIMTLGLSSLSNSFYRGVAQGLHEELSITWIFLLVLIIYIVLTRLEFYGFKQKKGKAWNINRELENKIEEYKKLHPEEEEIPIENVWKEYSEIFDKAHLSDIRSDRFWFILRITFVLFLVFQYITISQKDIAITHFRQTFTITKPYMTEAEEELILARFSAIQCKSDYLAVLDTLTQKLIGKQKELIKEIEDFSSSVKDKVK